jgi:hypothetical protein
MAVPSSNRKPRLLHLLAICSFFLSFRSAPCAAQEPSAKPEAPAPKQQLAVIPLPSKSAATAPSTVDSESQPEKLQDFAEFVAHFLQGLGQDCLKKSCKVLVTDFILTDGNTTPYGMQLADALSAEFARHSNQVHPVDRQVFHDAMSKFRVPPNLVKSDLARSLARTFDADFIVVGTIEITGEESAQLTARLLDSRSLYLRVSEKDRPAYSAWIDFLVPKYSADLSPLQSLTTLPAITSTVTGEAVYPAGADGTSSPKCTYMPNPPYSEEARKSQLTGIIDTEAIINSRGTLEDIRIVIGLPAGLNETTLAAMKTWRCEPAQKDGKPVAALVSFEVYFRMY